MNNSSAENILLGVEKFKAAERRRSLLSIFVAIGVWLFVIISSSITLYHSKQKVDVYNKEIDRLKSIEKVQVEKIAAKESEYNTLKANVEKLYAVQITPTKQIYQVKATARATGRNLQEGPEYKFSVFVDSAPEVLQNIESITYKTDHETFLQKERTSKDPKRKFGFSYVGWGCLTDIDVLVKLKRGGVQNLNFNMCESLGPEWQ